ncbi:MAG TPA: DUF4364 family protein [Tissierellia bacterium]|jgi:hypothetical protein|nr:DUF4364 family protein [Tissierellia bacterium]
MEPLQTQEKLSILHMLDIYGAQIPVDTCVDFFLQQGFLSNEELAQALAELVERGLLTLFQKGHQEVLTLSDDGMIVLQFFRERLSPEIQEKITEAVLQLKQEHPREELLLNYDPMSQMMELTFLENGRKVFGLEMLLEEETFHSHREWLKSLTKKDISNLRRVLFGLDHNK